MEQVNKSPLLLYSGQIGLRKKKSKPWFSGIFDLIQSSMLLGSDHCQHSLGHIQVCEKPCHPSYFAINSADIVMGFSLELQM
jgi:hypothetical protein